MTPRQQASIHPLVWFVATGGGLGYSPVAPGTAGTLGCGVLLWFLMPKDPTAGGSLAVFTLSVSVLAFIALSIWVSTRAEVAFGKDASKIVVDEFAGYLVAVLFLPKTLIVYIAAFLLFRIFDVLKPFPAARAETLPGGVGVVLDDLVAGIYANALIRVMLLATGI